MVRPSYSNMPIELLLEELKEMKDNYLKLRRTKLHEALLRALELNIKVDEHWQSELEPMENKIKELEEECSSRKKAPAKVTDVSEILTLAEPCTIKVEEFEKEKSNQKEEHTKDIFENSRFEEIVAALANKCFHADGKRNGEEVKSMKVYCHLCKWASFKAWYELGNDDMYTEAIMRKLKSIGCEARASDVTVVDDFVLNIDCCYDPNNAKYTEGQLGRLQKYERLFPNETLSGKNFHKFAENYEEKVKHCLELYNKNQEILFNRLKPDLVPLECGYPPEFSSETNWKLEYCGRSIKKEYLPTIIDRITVLVNETEAVCHLQELKELVLNILQAKFFQALLESVFGNISYKEWRNIQLVVICYASLYTILDAKKVLSLKGVTKERDKNFEKKNVHGLYDPSFENKFHSYQMKWEKENKDEWRDLRNELIKKSMFETWDEGKIPDIHFLVQKVNSEKGQFKSRNEFYVNCVKHLLEKPMSETEMSSVLIKYFPVPFDFRTFHTAITKLICEMIHQCTSLLEDGKHSECFSGILCILRLLSKRPNCYDSLKHEHNFAYLHRKVLDKEYQVVRSTIFANEGFLRNTLTIDAFLEHTNPMSNASLVFKEASKASLVNEEALKIIKFLHRDNLFIAMDRRLEYQFEKEFGRKLQEIDDISWWTLNKSLDEHEKHKGASHRCLLLNMIRLRYLNMIIERSFSFIEENPAEEFLSLIILYKVLCMKYMLPSNTRKVKPVQSLWEK